MIIDEPDDTLPHAAYFRDAGQGPSFAYMRYFSPSETQEYKLTRDLRLNNLERRVIELERKLLDCGR
jgi:hypothetical protein